MHNNIDLEKIKQTTFQDMNKDGLVYIFAGLMLLFTPFFYFNPAFVVFIILLVFFSVSVVEYIKNRITYPRIGRVELKVDFGEKSIRRNLLELILLLFIAITITLLILLLFEGDPLNIYDWGRFIPLLFGLIMFGPSVYLVENTGLRRYYLFVIFASTLGFAFSMISFDDLYLRIFLYFQTMGLTLFILGIVILGLFIKKYPVLEEGE
ncbi:MAG: hypothetical protein ACW981_00565 [Candidatus Hodarchaeales archaeon]|jgi:VIT1/CCC1 family predicted Fe2+/Mn2+ transporter